MATFVFFRGVRHLLCGLSAVAACAAQAQLLKAERPVAAVRPAAAAPGALASVQVTGGPVSALVTWTLNPAVLNPSPAPLVRGAATSLIKSPATPTPAGAPGTTLVERLVAGAAPVRLALSAGVPNQAVDPGPLQPGRAISYRVTVIDAKGAASVKEVVHTPPLPRDPTGLTATVSTDGKVTLGWQPVDGSVGYQISGTALPAPVTVTHVTQWTSSAAVPPGTAQWKVASIYQPGGVLTPATAWSAVNSHRVPTANRPFLFLPNGAGDAATSAGAYQQQCGPDKSDPAPSDCSKAVWFLGESAAWGRSWNSQYAGGRVPPGWPIAAFADLNDLGLGRRVNCTVLSGPPLSAVMCWATSHGRPPVAGETPNGAQLAKAAEQMSDVKSLNVIMMTSQGAFFGTWEAASGTNLGGSGDPVLMEGHYADVALRKVATVLDSQGAKFVPQACLSCHGGRYDNNRRIVVGASLLPLVPAHLTFSSPQARAANEEAIRRINRIILDTNPAPAIRDQIVALYNGNPDAAGTPANDNAVPPGWAAQPGLYKQVVAPFCGSCHFAQTGPLNFASFANLQQNRQRVQRAVCADFSMPHSEQGLRRFWSHGGPVSLPGLLSTALGYTKCPE